MSKILVVLVAALAAAVLAAPAGATKPAYSVTCSTTTNTFTVTWTGGTTGYTYTLTGTNPSSGSAEFSTYGPGWDTTGGGSLSGDTLYVTFNRANGTGVELAPVPCSA